MVEFDNDRKVMLQTLNQKIEHNDLDDTPSIKRYYIPIKDKVIEFVYDYLKSHKYCSKKFLAGMCIDKFNPRKINQSDSKRTRHIYRRKISQFFIILKELGLASQFNNNTIRVHEELSDYSLDDVYEIYNEKYKKV